MTDGPVVPDDWKTLVPCMPTGPLDVYRKKASFNWKHLKLLMEGEDAIRFKVKIKTLFKMPVFYS